jgi:hypothetical protein
MADPITLATIAIVGSAASSAVSAGGSLFSGFANSAAYKYQSGVAAVNEKIAKQNAEYSRSVGEYKAEVSGMKTRQQVGQTKAIQGASGFRVGEGSGEKVVESMQMLGASEQGTIRSNAARAAYGHEVEAINFGAQSKLYSMASTTSKVSGVLGATSSFLGGASSVSDKWLQYNSIFG